MNTVLVTALGTLASKSIIQQLRQRQDIFIIGADIYNSEYIVNVNDVDSFIQVDTVLNSENYLKQLINICKAHKVDMIFPVIDEEVELLAEHLEEFLKIGIIPCVSNLQSVNLCRDKFLTYKKIKEFIPEIVIETMSLKEYNEEWDYPIFAKPRKGRASIDCMKIDSKYDLEYLKRKVNTDDFIIQKYYDGKFFSADIARNPLNGNIFVLVREEIIRNKNGVGTVVKIVKDDILDDICKRVATIFDIKGVANMEFICDEKGYHLVEINPRFPAGTEYSCMGGFDLVNSQLNVMIGKDLVTSEPKYGQVYARRYEIYEM